jgi:hypothetical protein
VLLSLGVSGDSGIPLRLGVRDGNRSDSVETPVAIAECLALGLEGMRGIVADSKAYSRRTLGVCLERQVRLYLLIHDQQLPGNKGTTAIPTAAVVLALFAQVALIQLWLGNHEVMQMYGIQPHHLLICDALGLDHSWHEAPSVQKPDQFSQNH